MTSRGQEMADVAREEDGLGDVGVVVYLSADYSTWKGTSDLLLLFLGLGHSSDILLLRLSFSGFGRHSVIRMKLRPGTPDALMSDVPYVPLSRLYMERMY